MNERRLCFKQRGFYDTADFFTLKNARPKMKRHHRLTYISVSAALFSYFCCCECFFLIYTTLPGIRLKSAALFPCLRTKNKTLILLIIENKLRFHTSCCSDATLMMHVRFEECTLHRLETFIRLIGNEEAKLHYALDVGARKKISRTSHNPFAISAVFLALAAKKLYRVCE